MFRPTYKVCFLLSLAVCSLPTRPAQAQQVGVFFTGSTTGVGIQEGGDYTHGFKFTPQQSIFVNALGYLDFNSDGLSNDTTVGIFDSVGTLLTSTTVPSGTTPTLTDGFRYTDITPLLLIGGQNYTVAGRASGTETLFKAETNLGVNSL